MASLTQWFTWCVSFVVALSLLYAFLKVGFVRIFPLTAQAASWPHARRWTFVPPASMK